MMTDTPASPTPYARTTPAAWEQVAECTQDLRTFLDWLHEPRVRGLAERIHFGGCLASLSCTDVEDYRHALLLLAATGVTVDKDVCRDVDWTSRTARFGTHVHLYIRCPR